MGGNIKSDMSYETSKGGITWKSDVGTLLYNYPGKPYAVSGIDTSGAGLVFPEYAQEISYTSFESVDSISENGIIAKFLYNSDNERARMEVRQGGNTILTRWYPSGSYIKETAGSVTKEYTFIGGDAYSAPVVAVKTNGGEPVYYYLLRDYLGSITHVVDAAGNSVVAEYSYDAWGRMRNPSTWENYPPGSEPAPFIAGRGYTGHEHLPWFSFINMLSEGPDDVLKSGGAKSRNPGLPGAAGNGRVYDPLTGQFLSPDNYIQAPDFTQSFNRYGYCLNNPLKYTDPSGELFIIDDWVIGFFKGFARSIGGKHEDGHHTWFGDAWASANRHAGNSAKIWGGLFAADTDRGGWGWQIVSRFIWQLPQTILGFGAAHGENMIGQVDNVGYCEGATVVTKKGERSFFGLTTAYTLGSYIIGGNNLQPNVRNPLFQHEYGHYLQSQSAGWAYIPRFAIPSALNPLRNGGYTDLSENTEQDAQARSLLYFTKFVDGFTYDDWDYYAHPFYDRPNGTIVDRTRINESFLKGKLMIPTYIQELLQWLLK